MPSTQSGPPPTTAMYREVTTCRMTGSSNLIPVLDLGTQYLTGVFPTDPGAALTRGPLELVLCPEGGLLQLRHSYDVGEMYGDNYGYRSGLNRSMVTHLERKAAGLEALARPGTGDVVLDIGSNDGTLLKAYKNVGQRLGGIDPSAEKFRHFYPDHIGLVTDFFSAATFRELFGDAKAKIVTSIAMFYDLDAPIEFMRCISDVLSEDGVWHFEQSYMPAMLDTNSYDTICHEHLEYYGLAQIQWMAERADLKILDVELSKVNGGSFAVTAAKRNSRHEPKREVIDALLESEAARRLDKPEAYADFRRAVAQHRDDLTSLIRSLRADKEKVFGYGASTKGNVMLQYCGLTSDDLECIADVNPDKYGRFTPGTDIPIVSEAEAHARQPDYFLVLPWHFRGNLIEREQAFLRRGGKMIFPLPQIEIVGQ